MKIISLQSENIKRIKAIEIKPDGAIVRVTGKNANGKTSVLDSILYALGGERSIPSEPIRKGATKAQISIDLGEMVVERRFTRKGAYLKVTGKGGKTIGSPQKMLDALVGRLSFDPLAFSRDEPKRQAEVLRALAGLDLSDLDRQEAILMADRRDAGAEGKALKARLDGMHKPETPSSLDKIDTSAIEAKLAEGVARNIDIESISQGLVDANEDVTNAEEKLIILKEALAEKQEEAKNLGAHVDIHAIQKELSAAHNANVALIAFESFKRMEAYVDLARKNYEKLNRDVEAVRDARSQRIAEAKYPLDGLGISDEGEVTLNSLPMAQASLAEQLKTSTAVAMAINPKLRVLRITDGSLLDSESMAVIESLAKDNDYQVWIEQVDETGEIGFYIEDGSLIAIDGEAVDEAP